MTLDRDKRATLHRPDQRYPDPGGNLGSAELLPASGVDADADLSPHALSILLCEVGGEAFGVGVEQTDGVVDCPRITPLPGAPEPIIGVASVRGRMTLTVDLSLQAVSGEVKRRLVLLKGELQLGLLAEKVDGVLALTPEKLIPRKSGQKDGIVRGGGWAASGFFKHNGREVPLIDAALLAEI